MNGGTTTVPGQLSLELDPGPRRVGPTFTEWLNAQPPHFDRDWPNSQWPARLTARYRAHLDATAWWRRRSARARIGGKADDRAGRPRRRARRRYRAGEPGGSAPGSGPRSRSSRCLPVADTAVVGLHAGHAWPPSLAAPRGPIRAAIQRGELDAVKRGRGWVIPADAVERWAATVSATRRVAATRPRGRTPEPGADGPGAEDLATGRRCAVGSDTNQGGRAAL